MGTDREPPSFVLERQPSEAARVRRVIATACQGLPRDTVTTGQLLASELFTNALDHGAGPITLEVSRLPGELRIAVGDQSPDAPRVRRATVEDTRGRGLVMLEALAARWGVDTRPDGQGKWIWFALRTAD